MEMIFTIGIMVFLGIMTFFTLGLPKETIAGDVFAASGFPLLVMGICFLFCLVLLVKQIKNKQAHGEKLLDLGTPEGRAIAFTALALAVYIAILNVLGFIVSTLIFTVCSTLIMGYRNKVKMIIFSLIATAGMFALFGKLFFVPLPRGMGILKELSYLLY